MKHGCVRRLIAMGVAAVFAGSISAALPAEGRANWKAPEGEAQKKNPVPPNAQSIAQGKAIFSSHCVSCHGKAGQGDGRRAADLDPKPANLASAALRDEPDAALFWKITNGRSPMPAFGKRLSEPDRWRVVNYIRTLGPAAKPRG